MKFQSLAIAALLSVVSAQDAAYQQESAAELSTLYNLVSAIKVVNKAEVV